MSADNKGPFPKDKLSQMLDFGPETLPTPTPAKESGNFTERLKQIVKKLQELNDRIDNLSNRF